MAIAALSRIMDMVQMNSQALNHRNQEGLQKRNERLWSKSSYKCDICRDTGWTLKEEAGMQSSAKSCKCRDKNIVNNQWISAGINPENSSQTFTNFEVWSESSEKARSIAASYYMDFEKIKRIEENSILLCGQVGSGKTHLSVALALNFINKNIKVVYMPYRDIITKIKQNMLDYEYYNKTVSKYKTCEVLLMDDLFKGKTNEADKNIVFEILNYRYQNHLPVIISSELTVEGLLSVDQGIGSRIYQMCKNYIVEIEKSMENNYRLR